MLKLITLLLTLQLGHGFAKSFVLNETNLIKLSKESSYMLERIKATALEGDKSSLSADKSLGYKLYGGYEHNTSREKGMAPFIPVFRTINQYQLGVSKDFKYGITSKIEASVDSRSSASFSGINTSSVSLELGFDLWENFLGRMTKREYENAHLTKKQSQLKEKIDTSVFTNRVRRVYWSLVANQQKHKLTDKLLKAAQKQLKEAQKRRRQSVADASEVARYAAQVSQRKGQLLFLDYERENLFKTLKTYLPSLNGKSLRLGSYNVSKSIYEVLACTQKISTLKKTPYQFTHYDEISNILKQVQKNQELIDDSSGATVSLRTKFKNIGVSSNDDGDGTYSGSFQDSLDDMRDNYREGFEAGLQFSVPLGKASSSLKDVNKLINKKRLMANVDEMDSNIKSTHKQIANSIKVLSEVMKAQRANSKSLNIRVKDMRKKYSQARIPLYALIQDEDSLMNSDLSIIDTQLTILNTILDYFVVFTDMPCAFNRK